MFSHLPAEIAGSATQSALSSTMPIPDCSVSVTGPVGRPRHGIGRPMDPA
jgi:hypothetical protein